MSLGSSQSHAPDDPDSTDQDPAHLASPNHAARLTAARLVSDMPLTIDKDTVVDGTVVAPRLEIHGIVCGAVIAQELQLGPTGRVWGDVYARDLTIAQGGQLFGWVTTIDDEMYLVMVDDPDLELVDADLVGMPADRLDRRVERLRQTHVLPRLQEALRQLQQENVLLSRKLAEAEGDASPRSTIRVVHARKDVDADRALMEAQLYNVRFRLANRDAEFHDLQRELVQLRNQLSKERDSVEQLSAELQESRSKLVQAAERYAQVMAQLEQLRNASGIESDSDYPDHEPGPGSLSQPGDAKPDLDSSLPLTFEEDLAVVESRGPELAERFQPAMPGGSDLTEGVEPVVSELRKLVGDLTDRLRSLGQQTDQLLADRESWRGAVSDELEELLILQRKAASQLEDSAALRLALAESKEEIESLHERLGLQDQQQAQMRQRFLGEIEELKDSLVQSEQARLELRDLLTREAGESKARMVALTEMRQQLQVVEQRAGTLRVQLDESIASVKAIRETGVAWQEKAQRLTQLLAKANQRISDLKTESEQREQRLTATFQEELQQLRAQRAASQDEIAALDAAVADQRERMATLHATLVDRDLALQKAHEIVLAHKHALETLRASAKEQIRALKQASRGQE